jgi:hypothetical protein
VFAQIVILGEQPEKNIMQDGCDKQQPGVTPSEFLVVQGFVAQKTQCLFVQVKINLANDPPHGKRDQSRVDESYDQDAQFNPYHMNRLNAIQIWQKLPGLSIFIPLQHENHGDDIMHGHPSFLRAKD